MTVRSKLYQNNLRLAKSGNFSTFWVKKIIENSDSVVIFIKNDFKGVTVLIFCDMIFNT